MRLNTKTVKQILIYILLVGLAVGLLFFSLNRTRKTTTVFSEDITIRCDFEKINQDGSYKTDNVKYNFDKGDLCDTISFSGENCLYIPAWKQYQNLIVFPDFEEQRFITVNFKKKTGSEAVLVLEGKNNKSFYYMSDKESPEVINDWYNISLRFTTPVNFNDTVKIYLYNIKNQDTFIDDFSITISYKSTFPEYKDMEPLLIYIEEPELKKLEIIREDAFEKGILTTDDESFVDALVYGGNKMMQAELRLKGDWLDHLNGAKWSFRIKLKYDSWNGMRVFSVQTPYARGYTNEWLLHKMFQDNDVLATRYGFVPVYLNGKSLGIYSYEEHFQKELIEFNMRREGPIIKFSETDFWDFIVAKIPNEGCYETSVIEPFSEGKVMTDSIQFRYFQLASNLLDMFRWMKVPASDIFDAEKTAKFFALVNSKNAYHALRWHNMRFYYNPVLCRLEPIAFDNYAGPGEFTVSNQISLMFTGSSSNASNNSFAFLAIDSSFLNYYKKYLDEFLKTKNYAYYKKAHAKELFSLDSIIRIEFVPYRIDTLQFSVHEQEMSLLRNAFIDSLNKSDYLFRMRELSKISFNQKNIYKIYLYSDKYVKIHKNAEDKILVKLFMPNKIKITGVGNDIEPELTLNYEILPSTTNTLTEQELQINSLPQDATHIYFEVPGIDTVFKTLLVPWPAPTTFNPRNHMAATAVDLSKFTDAKTKTITFSGNLSFNNNIYIPAGYKVVFKPGTKINLTKKAAFVSCSVITMNGTKDAPVKIYSSDKSANGFTILQSPEKCLVNYVIFENMNTLNYMGWMLTGAVTFYESDVEISNTVFKDNHCEDMLNTIRSDFYVHHCTILNTYGDSYDSDFCNGIVDHCSFTNNGNDAIDFSTSDVIIKNTVINGCQDKGISVGENTKANISDVKISNVNIGVAGKDLSQVKIKNISISNAVYGFVLLQKKPEYGPSDVVAENVSMTDIGTSTLIERGSVLTLNGKVYKGTKPKLYALFYE